MGQGAGAVRHDDDQGRTGGVTMGTAMPPASGSTTTHARVGETDYTPGADAAGRVPETIARERSEEILREARVLAQEIVWEARAQARAATHWQPGVPELA